MSLHSKNNTVHQSVGTMWLMGYAHAIPFKELRETVQGKPYEKCLNYSDRSELRVQKDFAEIPT